MGNSDDKNQLNPLLRLSAPYPNPIVPKLPASAAFVALPGMQLVVDNAGRLWEGRGIGSHPPFTAAELGLTGMLHQVWVSEEAMVEKSARGVPSIPQEFFQRHPGEVVQVLVHVMHFDNPQSSHRVLESPYYNRNLVVGSGGIEALSTTVNDGLGYRWPGYLSETYYQWLWANGDFYNHIVVVGHNLGMDKAVSVARSMRNGD